MQNNPNLQPPPTDPLQQPTYLSQPPTQPQASPMHATRISATYGRPRVGGPISDFYGKYSTPHNQDAAGGETWIISPSLDATLVGTDADANGIVTRVTSVGSISWSQAQTESYCNHFLPTDASEFNRATGNPTYIDYHSSIGGCHAGGGSGVIYRFYRATLIATLLKNAPNKPKELHWTAVVASLMQNAPFHVARHTETFKRQNLESHRQIHKPSSIIDLAIFIQIEVR